MQIKTTVRYRLISVRMVVINKSTNSKCWRGCGERGTLVHCWWECRLVQPLRKTVLSFLKKLKVELIYNPVIPLLGIYLKKPKTLIWENICTSMFIAALITIAKVWKEPKCPSIDEWIKDLWYICTMKYYWAVKKEENLPFVTSWMDLEIIKQSEIRQSEKDKYHIISLICRISWTNWTNEQNRDRLIDTEQDDS